MSDRSDHSVTSRINIPPTPSHDAVVVVLRYTVYTMAVGLLTAWLMARAAAEAPGTPFEEGGLVEWVQFSLLIGAATTLALGSLRFAAVRCGLLVFALVSVIGAVREMDYLWDRWVLWLGWKAPALVLLVICGIVARRALRRERLNVLLQAPAMNLLWIGWLVVVVFAQILGEGRTWEAIMGEQYSRDFKRTLEELVETFGYMVLWIGGMELLIALRQADYAVSTRSASQRLAARPVTAGLNRRHAYADEQGTGKPQ